jgi:5-methylcytosine-specific restriction protein A
VRFNAPTRDDFKMDLYRMMNESIRQGRATAEINAGELHRRVGDYPGPNHRMPMCCEVMRDAFAPDVGDAIVEEPPSGQGASLTIRYVLPRSEPAPELA